MHTIGIVCGNPTPPEALNVLGASQSWKDHMRVRDLQVEINQGPPQGVIRDGTRSVEGNSSTCMMDRRRILTRGLPTGNELCHIFPSGPIALTG